MAEKRWDEVIESINSGVKGFGWSAVRNDARATWLGPFLSDVVLAVGLREIEYIDSRVDVKADSGLSARIVVFTRDTVVVADASGASARDDDVITSITAQPRAGLTRLTVSGSRSMWDPQEMFFEPWPGDFHVTAEWENGTNVKLPIAPIEYDSQRKAFMRIFEALSEQLGS